MPLDSELGKWIREKHKSQAAFAKKLGVDPTRLSRWLNLSDGISEDYQQKIRKLHYDGPWPAEEAQNAAAGGPAPYVTREELAEERGVRKAEIQQLRDSLEKAYELLRDLAFRLPKESRPKGY